MVSPGPPSWHSELMIGATKQCMQFCRKFWVRECLVQRKSSLAMQAAKPQWPADDCYHSCCNGEKAPTSPAVVSSRKEVTPSKKAASKAADKVSAHMSKEEEKEGLLCL